MGKETKRSQIFFVVHDLHCRDSKRLSYSQGRYNRLSSLFISKTFYRPLIDFLRTTHLERNLKKRYVTNRLIACERRRISGCRFTPRMVYSYRAT